MYRFISSLLVITITVIAVSAQKVGAKAEPSKRLTETPQVEDRKWTRIVSSEGNFNVLFPTKPKRTVGTHNRGTFVEFVLQTSAIRYSASIADFDIPDIPQNEKEAIFFGKLVSDVPTKLAAELKSQRKLVIGETEALELILQNEKWSYVNRYALIGNRMFQLLTTTTNELSDSQKVNAFRYKFLNSFQFGIK